MKQQLLLLFVISFIAFSFAVKERYDGFRLVRANITSMSHKQLIEKLVEHSRVDVWSHEGGLPNSGNVDLLLPVPTLERALRNSGMVVSVLMEDIQVVIDEQDRQRELKKGKDEEWFEDYHTFEGIVQEVQTVVNAHSDLCTYNPSVGLSIEGRSLVSVSLHGGLGKRGVSVPQVVIIGGQHAREWIAPATTMYVFERLATGYGTDPEVTTILNALNITIVPSSNPDGYDYSWTTSRLWRKNRRANSGGSYGVDLNRNWDSKWGGGGSSGTPSSDTYRGTAPFSEPETTVISNLVKRVAQAGPIKAALDIHSYSQLILRPYGWTRDPPPNEALLADLGRRMATIIRDTHGLTYTSQPSIDLYVTTGTAEDWFYEGANIPISYTYELRDTGQYGFVLPPAQIIPTGEEVFNALEYLLYYVATNP